MILIDCHQAIRQDDPGPTHPSLYVLVKIRVLYIGGREGGREGGTFRHSCFPSRHVIMCICEHINIAAMISS